MLPLRKAWFVQDLGTVAFAEYSIPYCPGHTPYVLYPEAVGDVSSAQKLGAM